MALKRIAIVSMAIDHFGSIIMDGIIAPYRVDGAIFFTPDQPFMVFHAFQIKAVCEALGRVAFPLFCFLCAEGFLHTRNPQKYVMRLFLFALISEVPYDLAHYGSFFEPKLQNVLFTLAVSVLTLCFLQMIRTRLADSRCARRWAAVGTVAAGMGLAFLLRGEYVFLGVLSVCLFYLLSDAGRWRMLGLALLLIVSVWVLLALPLLLLYSGRRGQGCKYFFYVFYPVHFLVFAAIAHLLAAG